MNRFYDSDPDSDDLIEHDTAILNQNLKINKRKIREIHHFDKQFVQNHAKLFPANH